MKPGQHEEYKIYYPPEFWDGGKFADLTVDRRKIMDSHVHCLFTKDMLHDDTFKNTYGFRPPFNGDAEELKNVMKYCDVEKSVIFYAGSGGAKEEVEKINDKISTVCRSDPSLTGFGYVPSSGDAEVRKLIDRAVNVHNLKGMGELFPENNAADYEYIFQAAHYFTIPVCVDKNRWEDADVEWFEKNLHRFSGMKLIFAHMGHDNPGILNLVKTFDNVYFDVSFNIHFYEARVYHQIKLLGADRVIFGTDFPCTAWTMYDDILRIERMPLSDAEKDMVFYKNMEKLLR
jgi:predicted TIM-barrel fold metal-dependent hydrolase